MNIVNFDFNLIHDCAEHGSEYFTIRLHYGGKFNGSDYRFYTGGEVDHIDLCDGDRMSVLEINEMLKKLGYGEEEAVLYYYLEPTSVLPDGLRQLQTDQHVNQFCSWVQEYKVMEVYCDHKTIEEVLKMQFNEPVETYAAPPKSGVLIEEIDDEGRVIEEPCTNMVLTKKPLNARTRNQKKKWCKCK